MPPRLTLGLAAIALGIAVLGAPIARAQNAANVHVLRDYMDEVKLADGTTATWRIFVAYDPVSGETVRTATDETGRVVERTVRVGTVARPSPDEVAAGAAIVRADPTVAALIAGARQPVVHGGFVLVREPGHPCAPGARCLQFEVADVNEAARHTERLRYVVVDLRSGRIVWNALNPDVEGDTRRSGDAR